MLTILVAGDFHGEIPRSFIQKLKKEKPGFILSTGDFCGSEKIVKFYFKYFYGKKEDKIPEKILKNYEKLEKISFERGKKVIEKLKKMGIKIYAIHGNWDPCPYPFDILGKRKNKHFSFRKLQDKNFRLVDFNFVKEKDFILIGGGSSTSPCILNKNFLKKILREAKTNKEKILAFFNFVKAKLEYRRREVALIKLFRKAKKIQKRTKKPIIFLTHNCPYKTKLDLIKKGRAKGKHYGSFLEKEIIKKFQPDFVFCGHIHESYGEIKIGKSKVFNVGSAKEGRFKILKI
ncbi:MAG: metallophosphoesterase [Candidatus Pacearchaeota archaeon]